MSELDLSMSSGFGSTNEVSIHSNADSIESLKTLQPGNAVWLLDVDPENEFDVPIGAIVRLAESGRIQVVDDENNEHWFDVSKANIRRMHEDAIHGSPDMIRLGEYQEEAILRNLLVRYKSGSYYTYTGSILISVNPYQRLEIYDHDHIKKYMNRKIGELEPHLFAISDNAYYNMQRNDKDQVIILSGESGGGKSEAVKLLMSFLGHVSGQNNTIEKQVMLRVEGSFLATSFTLV